MNIFAPDILSNLSFVMLMYLGISLLGALVSYTIKINHSNAIVSNFIENTIGVMFLVSAYAIFKTNFKSIFFLGLLFFIALYLTNRKKENSSITRDFFLEKLKIFLINTSALVFFFGLSYYFFYIYSNALVFGDNHFYANVAYSLYTHGVENINLDWTQHTHSVRPYHYTEAWFSALSIDIFGVNPLIAFYLFFIPIFFTIIYQGAVSVIFLLYKTYNNTSESYVYFFILASFIFIIQNIDIPFSGGFFIKKFHIPSIFFNFKLSIVYIIFLISFVFVLLKEYCLSYWFLLSLICFYPTLSPSVSSGISCVLLWLFFEKKISLKKLFVLAMPVFLYVLLFIGFYGLFGEQSKSEGARISAWASLKSEISLVSNIIFYGILPSFILYRIVFRINFIKTKIWYSKYILVFFIGGLGSTLVIFPLYIKKDMDGIQLIYNFLLPLTGIIFFIMLTYGLLSKKAYPKVLYSILFFGLFIGLQANFPSVLFNMKKSEDYEYSYDKNYFNLIKNHVSKNSKIGFYRNYIHKNPFAMKAFLFFPNNRISHFTNQYLPLSLSSHTIPSNTDPRFYRPDDFAFNRFIKNNPDKNIDSLTLHFIRLHKIKYIIKENGSTTPKIIDQLTHKKLINSINKNEFIILK